jgi:hypothetical protein
VSYAFGYLGDVMIQLIEQHDDTPSIYREMYGPDEEGFHHVASLVHDFAAARQHFLDQGFELACELSTGGVDAAYFDTPLAERRVHRDPRRPAVHHRDVRPVPARPRRPPPG